MPIREFEGGSGSLDYHEGKMWKSPYFHGFTKAVVHLWDFSAVRSFECVDWQTYQPDDILEMNFKNAIFQFSHTPLINHHLL